MRLCTESFKQALPFCNLTRLVHIHTQKREEQSLSVCLFVVFFFVVRGISFPSKGGTDLTVHLLIHQLQSNSRHCVETFMILKEKKNL